MDEALMNQVQESLEKGLKLMADRIDALETAKKEPQKKEEQKDPYLERMATGVSQFLEVRESGRLEGKSLNGKKEPEKSTKPSNLEGRAI